MNTPSIIKAIEQEYNLTFSRVEVVLSKAKDLRQQVQTFMYYGANEGPKYKYLIHQDRIIGLYLRSTPTIETFSFLNNAALQELQALNLTENGLKSLHLPVSLQQLQYFDISDNKNLKSLTFEAGLPALITFDASDSGLTNIYFPRGFDNLIKIDVSRNQLKECTFKEGMPALRHLDLSYNRLKTFTLAHGSGQLQFLYINKNKLQQLHFDTSLNQLKTLHLESNQLAELPFLHFSQLETLYVKDNPLKEYSENQIKGDKSGNATEIIGLLRATAQSGEGVNYSAKLIIVGNGRVGKTCIVNRLKGEAFNENQEYTHGISIQQLNKAHLPEVKTKKLDLKVWDFGGQEVFYATHQFFLSEESAYIYAWTDEAIAKANRKKDLKKSPVRNKDKWRKHDYWLDNIRMHGKESPVQIVKTHCLSAKKILPFERLKKQYDLENEPLDFDAESEEPRYLSNLKAQLTKIINELPLLGGTIANSYIEVIDHLKKEKEKGISELSKTDFWTRIAKESQIIEKDLDKLLGFLINIGEIIYFPDNKKLAARIFINPQSLIEQIYQLIENNDFLVQKGGEFSANHAKEKLGANNWEVLLELLISFDLVYKKKIGQLEQFIAPQYLKEIPLSGNEYMLFEDKKEGQRLQFTLYYPRFLPENVMINVLSKYGPYAIGVVYRNGIYFKKSNQTEGCIIECDETKRTIKVYTNETAAARVIAKEVFDKFMDLSKKASIYIISNQNGKPVDCKALITALEKNIDFVPTIDTLDYLPISHFGFLSNKMEMGLKNKASLNEKNLDKPNNISEEKLETMHEIQKLVAANKLEQALEKLLNLAPDDLKNEVISQQSKLSDINRKERMGIASSSEADLTLNKIRNATLSLFQEIQHSDDTNTLEKETVNKIRGVIKSGKIPAQKEKVPFEEAPTKLSNTKTKILFLAANPTDQARIQSDLEYREIIKELALGKHRDSFEFLHPQFSVTTGNLLRAMNQKPNIVHFSGHGMKGGIIITRDDNSAQIIPTKALLRLFKRVKDIAKYVLLNSCYSSEQAKTISTLGFYVIGYNVPVNDQAAIKFAKGFYNGLGEGKAFQEAFDDAMFEWEAEDSQDSDIVEVWKDGQLLDL